MDGVLKHKQAVSGCSIVVGAGGHTKSEYVHIRIVEFRIVLVELIEAGLERRVEDGILQVVQLLLPFRAEGFECRDYTMECGCLVQREELVVLVSILQIDAALVRF